MNRRFTVILDADDQQRLDALADVLKCSKMEATRRAIRHLEYLTREPDDDNRVVFL